MCFHVVVDNLKQLVLIDIDTHRLSILSIKYAGNQNTTIVSLTAVILSYKHCKIYLVSSTFPYKTY